MTLRKLVNRTVLLWQTWKFQRVLPELRLISAAERKARRRHGKVSGYQKARRDLVHARLRMECRR